MRILIRVLGAIVPLLMSACAGDTAKVPPVAPQVALLPPPTQPLQCVPYARGVSGIDIRGDAWTWWEGADGRYNRGKKPRPGAVLVFARTSRLPLGHVAVVRQTANSREILVTHANWGSTRATRGRVADDVRVIDVSPGNDWSEVRVWNGNGFGKVYPAYGFIYPVPIGV